MNNVKSYVAMKRGNTKRHYENTGKYHDLLHSTYDELIATSKLYSTSAKKAKDDGSKYDSALRNKNPLFRIGDHEERVSRQREKMRTSGMFFRFNDNFRERIERREESLLDRC